MKKSLKITIIIITSLMLLTIIDLISIYTINKPLFAIKEDNIYKGIFYDTYNCSEYSVPQIKIKGTKYSCSKPIILKEYIYTIETNEIPNCNKEKKLYKGIENKNIYTYCLDNIKINDGTNLIELKDYMEENNNVMEEIINTLEYIDTYKDGGSKLYRDKDNKFTNNGLSIIKCNTTSGNQDIYIGTSNMNYETNFCGYDNNMKEFIN